MFRIIIEEEKRIEKRREAKFNRVKRIVDIIESDLKRKAESYVKVGPLLYEVVQVRTPLGDELYSVKKVGTNEVYRYTDIFDLADYIENDSSRTLC